MLEELRRSRAAGGHQRASGRRYPELRARTEERLRQLFVESGGRPERRSPHYLVLGRSAWCEQLADDMETIEIPLHELPPDITSFTSPDSFTAMGLAPEFGLPYEERP